MTITIDTGNHFLQNSIAIDAAGYAHISYFGSMSLKYATNMSGAWITATLDTPEIGEDNSIAVDTAAMRIPAITAMAFNMSPTYPGHG